MDYYNEFDEYPLQWLRNLQAAGHIPDGTFDGRSIVDVKAEDVRTARQAHFFAGIGGWPLALKLAGWPEDQEVWTGSCPCQPFSVAGARKGTEDKRHLWPEFFRLIAECRPSVVFGEQVASPAGREWLSGVQDDLESVGYAVGRADVCAPSVGAPQIRQRLWWVASSASWKPGNGQVQRGWEHRLSEENGRFSRRPHREVRGEEVQIRGVVGPEGERFDGSKSSARTPGRGSVENTSPTGRMGRPAAHGRIEECEIVGGRFEGTEKERRKQRPWSYFDALPCRDGVYRRVESGTFPLAHGIPGRVGKLRAYGNAIISELAAEFVKAYLEVVGG